MAARWNGERPDGAPPTHGLTRALARGAAEFFLRHRSYDHLRAILAGEKAKGLPGRSVSIVSRKRPRQNQTLLSDDQVAALVAAYLAGLTLDDLASEFGIHQRTAAAHLDRRGIPRRRHGLSPAQIAETKDLYQEGWSLDQIADRFDVWPRASLISCGRQVSCSDLGQGNLDRGFTMLIHLPREDGCQIGARIKNGPHSPATVRSR